MANHAMYSYYGTSWFGNFIRYDNFFVQGSRGRANVCTSLQAYLSSIHPSIKKKYIICLISHRCVAHSSQMIWTGLIWGFYSKLWCQINKHFNLQIAYYFEVFVLDEWEAHLYVMSSSLFGVMQVRKNCRIWTYLSPTQYKKNWPPL